MKHTYLDQPIDNEPKLKVLLDADILLELFVNRSGFVEDAERLLTETEKSGQVEVYITDKCLKRIRIENDLGDKASSFIEEMVCGRVIKIDSDIRDEARTYCLPDFDSAEEVVCAKNEQLNAIVTQNPQNFDGTNNLLIWSVESLLASLQLNKNLSIQYEEKQFVNSSSCIANLTRQLENLTRQQENTLIILGSCGSGKTSLVELFYNIESILFSGHYDISHLSFLKKKRIINFDCIQKIRFDDFDNWIASDEAFLLFRNHYSLLDNNFLRKNRIYCTTIHSLKYLHKHLLELLLYKFPKKNINNYYELPFYCSPHQLKLSQNSRWIWHLKLSLTIALNAG